MEGTGKRRMIYLLIALGCVVALGLVVYVVGLALPVKHSVTMSRVIKGTPAEVWSTLVEIEHHPQWRTGVITVTRTAEDPLAWVEKNSMGEMPLKTEVFEPQCKWVARISDPKLPFGGTWTYLLEPSGSDTRVTITEDGEVYSPVFRFMSRFVFGHSKSIENYLNDLEKKHGA